jgi:hypothetical protein
MVCSRPSNLEPSEPPHTRKFALYRRVDKAPIANPTLLTITALMLILACVPYNAYFEGVAVLHYLLGTVPGSDRAPQPSDFSVSHESADQQAVGPLVVGFALPRYGISGVFLIFSIFALTGGMAAIFMVETRGRVLEEVSP